MAFVRVRPTDTDVAIADAVVAHTGRPTEHIAETLTWGAVFQPRLTPNGLTSNCDSASSSARLTGSSTQ